VETGLNSQSVLRYRCRVGLRSVLSCANSHLTVCTHVNKETTNSLQATEHAWRHIAQACTSVSVDWTPARLCTSCPSPAVSRSRVVYWHTLTRDADQSHASRTQTHRLLENYIGYYRLQQVEEDIGLSVGVSQIASQDRSIWSSAAAAVSE